MQYIVLYLLLLLILLPGAKYERKGIDDLVCVQKNINNLRGIFAIFIIYTHCTLAYSELPVLLIPLRKVSTFGVGFFFILSGYGLAYSYNSKKKYLDGFLKRKISKILFTALFSRVITQIIIFFAIGRDFSIKCILSDMNWYIWALIVLYFVFYLAYSIFGDKCLRVLCVWFIVVFITCMLCICSQKGIMLLGRSYFISEWAFPFGITIYEYREKIERIISKQRVILIVIMLMLIGFTFALSLNAKDYSILDLVGHNTMLIPFFFFVFLICKYYVFNNWILNYLNVISFELYLYQFGIFVVLQECLNSLDISYFLLSVLLTVILASLVKNLCIGIIRLFSNYYNQLN